MSSPVCLLHCSITEVHMYGDEEETWQVAGRRRRRVSNPAGDCNSQQQQHPPKVVVQTGTRDRNSNGSADRKRKPRHRTTGGYSYTKNSSGVPIEASQENRVQEELRKLDHLKGLLRGTTLWKRLVDGLASILPQLGLSVPLPLREAAESMTETGVPLIATKDEKSSSLLRQKEDRKCDEQRVACFPTAGGPTLRQGGQAAGATGAGVWSESLDAGQGRLHSSPAHEAGEDNSTKGSTGGGVALRELVCYGIGNFSETHASRYQLAVALCLRDLLFPTTSSSSTSTSSRDDARNSSRSRSSGEQVQKSHPGGHKDSAPATMMTATATSTPNVSQDRRGKDVAPATAAAAAPTAGVQPAMLVFDPVMGDAERAILAALGCGVLNTNEEGKRSCFASVGRGEEEASSRDRRTPTLFFMPHCPQRLYSNLLWANWSSPGEQNQKRRACVRCGGDCCNTRTLPPALLMCTVGYAEQSTHRQSG